LTIPKRILIVEDEMLIAKHIKNCLERNGYDSAGLAINYSGAIEIIKTRQVDLALLDIKLSGKKSGLEVAEFLKGNYKIPFMFLTSFNDKETLGKLKILQPMGYLNKPIREVNLITALDLFFSSIIQEQPKTQIIKVASKMYNINLNDLVYVETDHVYIKIYFKNGNLLLRCSLSNFLEQIPAEYLIKISRSCAINPFYIEELSKTLVVVNGRSLKVSKRKIEDLEQRLMV